MEVAKKRLLADRGERRELNDESRRSTSRGHVEVVRLLAELGANVETPENDGETPAHIAAQEGHVEVVRLLAELGANVETPEQRRRHASLHRGAEGPRGGGEAAGRARGERRDADNDGATPAYIAAQEGPRGGGEAAGRARGERRDADANDGAGGPRQPGRTSRRSRKGHVEVVRLLAELGANVETPDNDGATPAYIAAQKGHVEVVRVLAELGANVETPANNGATPAFIAAQHGHVDVVRLLAELGANVETPNDGATPAFIAAQERPRGGGEAAGRARGERRDAEERRRHASLHRGGGGPRGGGEAAGRARGERRDAAGRTTARHAV